ncbi:MAG: MFS transporter [Kangiellaceae bacterium]|nr:MFS transporter [Kangiellaceae bacterium]
MPRFYRPTLLDTFNLTNAELGDMFALYGIVAMLSYFPGGFLADRFPPRKLLSSSLLITSLGGFAMYFWPTKANLYLLFGIWGFSTIMMFWSAMLKETRIIAGASLQGLGFGLLDGGRGLIASLAALIGGFLLADFLLLSETPENKALAINALILYYSSLTLTAAVLVWLCLPKESADGPPQVSSSLQLQNVTSSLKDQKIWLQSGIVVCAYCGFKSLDNYGLYATQVLNFSQLESTQITTYTSFARPIVALIAGLLADRVSSSKTIKIFFGLASLSFIAMALIKPDVGSEILVLVIFNIGVTFIAVYALRAVYFALVAESKIKLSSSGTAIGLISLIGFTPDIFFSAITGRILDSYPGFEGFQNYFLLMCFISLLGLTFAYLLAQKIRKLN